MISHESREIILDNTKVNYTLRVRAHARARAMRLVVYPNGAFVVSVPQSVSVDRIEHFLQEKARWILDKLAYFKKFSGVSSVRPLTKSARRREYLMHKEKARELVLARLEHFNAIYNFSYNRVSIRAQKSRWGSCSKKGNLNFNYKIALLPPHLADLIIVHELCHLKEFNHSKKFWNLVAQALPDYRERIAMLGSAARALP